MRKIILMVLASLFLSGCAARENKEVQPSNTSTMPFFETITETFVSPTVIPADYEKNSSGIYLVDTNWDIDIFQYGMGQLDLIILSEYELEEDSITVELPIDCGYTVKLIPHPKFDAPSKLNEDPYAFVSFSYDTYLHYCDFDWAELAEKHQAAQEAYEDWEADRNNAKKQKYEQAQEAYQTYYEKYRSDYLLLDDSMLPHFYTYQIMITLDSSTLLKDEVFQSVSLTVNGETSVRDIGEVRLHGRKLDSDSSEGLGISRYPLSSYCPIQDLSGSLTVSFLDFIAEEDLTITGVVVATGDLEIGELEVQILSDNGMSISYVWDGKTPITVAAGSSVDIWTTFTDWHLKQTGFDFRSHYGIEYEVDGIETQYVYEHRFVHEQNQYEIFAAYYNGLDFSEYYEEYYYPCILGIES